VNAPFRRILVAVDGSVASLRAARAALDFAASCHARIRVVAVADDGAGPQAQTSEQREAQLQDALDHLCRLGSDAGLEVEPVMRRREGAEPYELILEEAAQWDADMLFMGRRGHRGLGRALLGSQAEHVLEFARLPVAVVPESARP
jgi:nucleotide-binding universal stress UspA family protein